MAVAVDGLSTRHPASEWVVPPPGTAANPAVSGAAPASLALINTSAGPETYTRVRPPRPATTFVATGTLAAGAAVVVRIAARRRRADPIIVRASGPMAVSEDAGPSAGFGVVSMPGIPLAAAIGA